MNMKNSETGISLVSREFKVQVYELDMNSKATMAAICNYLQETGISHGMMLMDKAGINLDDLVFVLTRLHVRMFRYPSWKETVKVRTWLSPITSRYAIRNFEIESDDGELLGAAINSAVPFNLKERNRSNIEIDISGVETLQRGEPLPHLFDRLEQPGDPAYEKQIVASYSDCDLYRHINNVKYIQWCLDTLPQSINDSGTLYEIDINFRSEGNCGDMLISRAAPIDRGESFIHGITELSSARELVRMKSVWR